MDFLYSVTIHPLELVYKFLYLFLVEITETYSFSLLCLSLVTYVVCLPLKKLAASMQKRERRMQAVMGPQLAAIKEQSQGAQRQARTAALYRRYAYNPLMALRSSMGIFLQVPFLIAAYVMLSSLEQIRGQSAFGIIPNLGTPDGLLGGLNALPLLMAVVNIIAVFTTCGFTRKEKLQGCLIAFLFLVLLYPAPSALLIYWIGNNILVLIENIAHAAGLPRFLAACVPQRTVVYKHRTTEYKTSPRYWLAAVPLPFLLFCLNPAFFIVDKHNAYSPQFWIWQLGGFALCSSLLWTLLALLPRRSSLWGIRILHSLFLLCFVVTVFFPHGVGLFDGRKVDSLSPKMLTMIYCAYLTAFGGFLWVCTKRFDVIQRATRIICILNVGFVIYAGILQMYAYIPTLTAHAHPVSHARPFSEDTDLSFATQRNIIIILADMLQGSSVEQVLRANPELSRKFTGFTAYTRAVSVFPFTSYSLPTILSGNVYANGPAPWKENNRASLNDGLLTDAEKSGYSRLMLSESIFSERLDQWYYPNEDIVNIAPYYLVSAGLSRILKIPGLLVTEDEFQEMYILKQQSDKAIRRFIKQNAGNDTHKLIFIHDMRPHTPVYFKIDESLRPTLRLDASIQEYFAQLRKYFDEICYVLDSYGKICARLQQLGLYDDSLIIIAGDHGHFIGNWRALYEAADGAQDFDGYTFGNAKRSAAMYNPAMLIKLPKNTGELSISHDAMSVLAIREIVQQYIADNKDGMCAVATRWKSADMPVVIFSKEDPSPYFFPTVHERINIKGNIAELPSVLAERMFAEKYDYTMGENAISLLRSRVPFDPQAGWLCDVPAVLSLRIREYKAGKTYALTLEGKPLVKPGMHERQRLIVKTAGIPVAELAFTSEEQSFSLDLPSQAVNESGELVLEFVSRDATTHGKLGLGTDQTVVSVYMRNIVLTQKSN